MVPRLSYASVEEAFLELAAASPVRSAAQTLGRRVTSTLESLRVSPTQYACSLCCPKALIESWAEGLGTTQVSILF